MANSLKALLWFIADFPKTLDLRDALIETRFIFVP